jgi:hypothetical protein
MNRKLRHTSVALSATATAFVLLLLAASPSGRPVQLAVATPALATATIDASEAADEAAPVRDVVSHRRHLRQSRALLALPYFSFAQGLRRNRS